MSARRLPWKVLAFVLVAGGALAQACSSSSSGGSGGGCVDNPNACADGTTCWPTCNCAGGATCGSSACSPKLQCLPSAQGKKPHDSCKNTPGTPTCSDHQACVEINSGFGGCLTYCDETKPNHGCPDIESCVDLRVGSASDAPVIHVCAVVEADAGKDSGPEETDTGLVDALTDRPM